MIDARFHCPRCSLTWGAKPSSRDEREVTNFIRKASRCRTCGRNANIEIKKARNTP